MASPTEIRRGRVIQYQGVPHLVLDMMHRTQGRQAGFVQTVLRNLNTGASTTTKFRSSDNVDFCHTENKKLEFSYVDESGYHFMCPDSFEDTIIPTSLVEDQRTFLIEGATYEILFVDDRPVRVNLPASVEMKVIDAPDAIRGDTTGNVQKPVKTQTGLTVQVPLFIKTGEIIRVSSEDGAYLGRA